jgi:hypothetical protein
MVPRGGALAGAIYVVRFRVLVGRDFDVSP